MPGKSIVKKILRIRYGKSQKLVIIYSENLSKPNP